MFGPSYPSGYSSDLGRVGLSFLIFLFLGSFFIGFIVRGFYSLKITLISGFLIIIGILTLPSLFLAIANQDLSEFFYYSDLSFILFVIIFIGFTSGAFASSIMPSMKKASQIELKKRSIFHLLLPWVLSIFLFFLLFFIVHH